jgi:hypothetical protein
MEPSAGVLPPRQCFVCWAVCLEFYGGVWKTCQFVNDDQWICSPTRVWTPQKDWRGQDAGSCDAADHRTAIDVPDKQQQQASRAWRVVDEPAERTPVEHHDSGDVFCAGLLEFQARRQARQTGHLCGEAVFTQQRFIFGSALAAIVTWRIQTSRAI